MIGAVALELNAAVLEHARLCETAPDDAAGVVQAAERIRRLVVAYGEAVSAGSGWGNPLAGVVPAAPGDGAPGEDPRDLGTENEPDGPTWFSIVENHALHVHDADAVIALARQRTGTEPGGLEEALIALCGQDGWRPEQYPGGIVELDRRSNDVCRG
ncbi:hypothetical protein [Kitasatospora phosalacinea]|uniref:Uncharacterized protein n=1 Tax=Kitasatospora phosalacinea TaxID=2065 RepID=A0A9W6PGI8_9ACTN|nr:hypothetical protein [Kitasatospora phosalacinea]GLW55659.1 hypothetical protein Kpho01_36700 [Kitasatospora phosalacinea]